MLQIRKKIHCFKYSKNIKFLYFFLKVLEDCEDMSAALAAGLAPLGDEAALEQELRELVGGSAGEGIAKAGEGITKAPVRIFFRKKKKIVYWLNYLI